MREIVGDLFTPSTYVVMSNGNYLGAFPDAICITTNGFVKSNGEAVMGRGCAKQAATKWPELPGILATAVRYNGNITQHLMTIEADRKSTTLVAFPVKPIREVCVSIGGQTNVVNHLRHQFKPGDMLPGWACKAKLHLIEASARQLVILANELDWQTIIIPRPGCGAGELSWVQVKPLLCSILDDRFCAITTRNAY